MMRKKLIVYGIGKLAEYATYVFNNDSDYEVIGHCIEENFINDIDAKQMDLISFENIENNYPANEVELFIAVGNNVVREKIYTLAKQKGYSLASYVSSKTSSWANMELGENCFIGEGSVIQPFVKIGDNTFLFGARLGHHCIINNHSLLSGPTVGGNVVIGEYCFLGLNSVIQQNIVIGEKNIIGMGVAIKTSTPDKAVFSAGKFNKRNVNFDDISKSYLN